MNLTGNTVLITGGGTGIGLALAEAFLSRENEVIICGRREEILRGVKEKLPRVHIRQCDVASEQGRRDLVRWATAQFGNLNILVNNAGIQRDVNFRLGEEQLVNGEDEIEVNFRAPVHLSALFIPHLMSRKESAIVNVTSGLGFIPLALFPVYCATKAAMHSFSIALRHQLATTPIKVFEIIPPTVDTELNKESRDRRGMKDRGISAREVADVSMPALERDEYEIAVGRAQWLRTASRNEPEAAFARMNPLR